MRSDRFHEDFSREDDDVRPSERNLGVTFAAACAIIAAIRLYHGGSFPVLWLLASGAFLVCAFFWTAPLRPIGILWHRLGRLLFKVTNPVVMVVLYFGTVVPTGLILRLTGKDPLSLKMDRECDSYWLDRHPPGPTPQEMKNQF
jgi:hypothetical protein